MVELKIRRGFVSNSSSSSFILKDFGTLTKEQMKQKYRFKKEVPDYVKDYIYRVMERVVCEEPEYFSYELKPTFKDWLVHLKALPEGSEQEVFDSFNEAKVYHDVVFTDFDCCEDLEYDDDTKSEEDILKYIRDNAEVMSDDFKTMFGFSIG